MNESNELEFLVAYCGSPSFGYLPRLREYEEYLQLSCKWRSPWFDYDSLGFELLNEMHSISIDGRTVAVRKGSDSHQWKQWQYGGALKLPTLAPGKHVIRCEVDSALAAMLDMAGLANDAPSKEWPPTKHRWKRTCESELMVYAKDAELVRLTVESAFDPVANGSVKAKPVIIRPKGDRLTATVSFDADAKQGFPLSVGVALRLAGQTYSCGKLSAVTSRTIKFESPKEFTVDIGTLAPQIQEAEIILTPNPKAVESNPDVDRIWGKEIILSHVPLARQDITGNKTGESGTSTTNAAQLPTFGPVREFDLSDDAYVDFDSHRIVKWTDSPQFPTGKTFNESIGDAFARALAGQKDSAPAKDSKDDKSQAETMHQIWVRQQGLDAVFVVTSRADRPDIVGLNLGMVLLVLPSEAWSKTTPEQLDRDIASAADERVPLLEITAKGNLPTYGFKTSEGARGIFQITGFTDNPRGVKLRYKLVEMKPPTREEAAVKKVALELLENFVTNLVAIAPKYPELSGFPAYAASRTHNLDINFEQGLLPPKTIGKGYDIADKGMVLWFRIAGDTAVPGQPAWGATWCELKALHLSLYAGFFLSSSPSPGLREELNKLIAEQVAKLEKLNKEVADEADNSVNRKPGQPGSR